MASVWGVFSNVRFWIQFQSYLLKSKSAFGKWQPVKCLAVCIAVTGTGIRNQAVEIRTNYRVNPLAIGISPPFCSRCRLVDCLTACYSYATCQGVDYDAGATSCYLLNSTNACSSLTPATNAIHISTVQCSRAYDSCYLLNILCTRLAVACYIRQCLTAWRFTAARRYKVFQIE